MADGGIRVTKPITGEPHLIEDIRVSVPHRVSVYIPADKALNSKDLHRALATGAIFQLSGFIKQDAPEGIEEEEDLTPLPKAPPVSRSDEPDLKESLARLERQIALLTKTIQDRPAQQIVHNHSVTPLVTSKESASIELDAPMFIPDDLALKADVNIQVKGDVSNDGIDNAASKLKALRQSKR